MDREIIEMVLFLIIIFIVSVVGFLAFNQEIEFKTVVSGSMSPAINAGDVVIISKTDTSELKVGDIITFNESGTFTTHRIINITGEGFVTKGDANKDPDVRITSFQSVQGKVVFTIPYLGYLGAFVRTPLGFAIFILIPGALIILNELRKIKEEVRPGKKKVPRLEYRPHASDYYNLRKAESEHRREDHGDFQYKYLRGKLEETEHKKEHGET